MAPGVRVRLDKNRDIPADDRARSVLGRFFSLGGDEVDRLAGKLPLELTRTSLSDPELERMGRALEAIGIRASFEPLTVEGAPCPRHPRLLCHAFCPKCQGRACGACVGLSRDSLCAKCGGSRRRWTSFRRIRIALLTAILALVSLGTYSEQRRITSWSTPLDVSIIPIGAEARPEVGGYIDRLEPARFEPVAAFLDREARRHGVEVAPRVLEIDVAPKLDEQPPLPPVEGGMLEAIRFSLEFRWWVFQVVRKHDLPHADIRLFVLYHAPAPGMTLDHSFGLAKARSGIVHAFAFEDADASNNVVIAHELLHTVSATDKYDPSGQPSAPDGLGDPARTPLYPQDRAEIMAGRIAITAGSAKIPESLDDCTVGPATASEVGWK
ncbi:MAG: hypothetical protein IT384_19240 [Deltaproteobacteria bacterium]|nr:hypothetical protein [Deltaproteobacteria bacterium]